MCAYIARVSLWAPSIGIRVLLFHHARLWSRRLTDAFDSRRWPINQNDDDDKGHDKHGKHMILHCLLLGQMIDLKEDDPERCGKVDQHTGPDREAKDRHLVSDTQVAEEIVERVKLAVLDTPFKA